METSQLYNWHNFVKTLINNGRCDSANGSPILAVVGELAVKGDDSFWVFFFPLTVLDTITRLIGSATQLIL